MGCTISKLKISPTVWQDTMLFGVVASGLLFGRAWRQHMIAGGLGVTPAAAKVSPMQGSKEPERTIVPQLEEEIPPVGQADPLLTMRPDVGLALVCDSGPQAVEIAALFAPGAWSTDGLDKLTLSSVPNHTCEPVPICEESDPCQEVSITQPALAQQSPIPTEEHNYLSRGSASSKLLLSSVLEHSCTPVHFCPCTFEGVESCMPTDEASDTLRKLSARRPKFVQQRSSAPSMRESPCEDSDYSGTQLKPLVQTFSGSSRHGVSTSSANGISGDAVLAPSMQQNRIPQSFVATQLHAVASWNQSRDWQQDEFSTYNLNPSEIFLAWNTATEMMALLAGDNEDVRMATLRNAYTKVMQSKEHSQEWQDALSDASKLAQSAMIEGFHGHVRECSTSMNGNHAIQKIIEIGSMEQFSFITEELIGFARTLARNVFGCRVCCRLLEHSNLKEAKISVLIDEIAGDLRLPNKFSSIVLSHILQYGEPGQRHKVACLVSKHLRALTTSQGGSFVVEKAFENCDASDRDHLLEQICSDRIYFQALARDRFGRHVRLAALRQLGANQACAGTMASTRVGRPPAVF